MCKHFIESVEKRLYGWFWACPSGPECKYKHKLPPGYMLKSEMRDLLLEQRSSRRVRAARAHQSCREAFCGVDRTDRC